MLRFFLKNAFSRLSILRGKNINMTGRLDAVQKGAVYGWVFDAAASDPACVEILVDGVVVGTGTANIYRADLEGAGINGGKAAFEIRLPPDILDSRFHMVEARDRASRVPLDGSPVSVQLLAVPTVTQFKNNSPWIDLPEREFSEHLTRIKSDHRLSAQELDLLRSFREDGFVCLPQAISHAVIDEALAHVEESWRVTPRLLVVSPALPQPADIGEIQQVAGFRSTSYRYLDFHNISEAAAEIMCSPAVLRFVNLYFNAALAGMQSLLFENGTEQAAHQDFPYVHSLQPAFLAGSWVALEDVDENAGPLFYYPKSHRLVEKHTFSDGSIFADGDGPHIRQYEAYLQGECQRLKLERRVFLPKKGDVLIWHSALVHGGTKRNDPGKTRKSMVSHYTPRVAYPFDRRSPNKKPIVRERNGCLYYGWRAEGHVESRFKLNQSLSHRKQG